METAVVPGGAERPPCLRQSAAMTSPRQSADGSSSSSPASRQSRSHAAAGARARPRSPDAARRPPGTRPASHRAARGSSSGVPPKSPSRPQVELTTTSRSPSPRPIASRYRRRSGRLATSRSKHGSPASTATSAASGHCRPSTARSSSCARMSADARTRPSRVSRALSSPHDGVREHRPTPSPRRATGRWRPAAARRHWPSSRRSTTRSCPDPGTPPGGVRHPRLADWPAWRMRTRPCGHPERRRQGQHLGAGAGGRRRRAARCRPGRRPRRGGVDRLAPRLPGALPAAGRAGLPSRDAALTIAQDGLASLHRRMRYRGKAGGADEPLDAAFAAGGPPLATVTPFRQPATRQPHALLVPDLDVVMGLGPVITGEHHTVAPLLDARPLEPKRPRRPNGSVLERHDIPPAVCASHHPAGARSRPGGRTSGPCSAHPPAAHPINLAASPD